MKFFFIILGKRNCLIKLTTNNEFLVMRHLVLGDAFFSTLPFSKKDSLPLKNPSCPVNAAPRLSQHACEVKSYFRFFSSLLSQRCTFFFFTTFLTRSPNKRLFSCFSSSFLSSYQLLKVTRGVPCTKSTPGPHREPLKSRKSHIRLRQCAA